MNVRLPVHLVILVVVALSGLIFIDRSRAQSNRTLGMPELSVLILDKGPTRIQQQLIQQIRIVTAYPFDALRVDTGKIAGAEVIELQSPATRSFESWGVKGFVYEASRAIFPQRSGSFTVPAVRVTGRVTNELGMRQTFEEYAPPEQLNILGRAIELTDEPWLVASDVRLTETWSRQPHDLKAGEVAQRLITAKVSGALAEQITAPTMPVGTGIQVLTGPTTRHNEMTVRGVVATLTQQFDVRIASEQLSDIPPVEMVWWNTQKQRANRSSIRGWRIEPALPDRRALVDDLLMQAEQDQRRGRMLLLLVVLPLLIVVLISRLFWRRQPRWLSRMTWAGRRFANAVLGSAIELPSIGFSRITEEPGRRESDNQSSTRH